MNIADLAFEYDLDIEQDVDFDGATYDLIFTYFTATHHDVGKVKMSIELKQWDVDELYNGAMKLVKSLKPYITEGY